MQLPRYVNLRGDISTALRGPDLVAAAVSPAAPSQTLRRACTATGAARPGATQPSAHPRYQFEIIAPHHREEKERLGVVEPSG